tara:strand:- start:1291 stop:1515 length:225 start_codon:yes stop_codon:yes gene_type:complete
MESLIKILKTFKCNSNCSLGNQKLDPKIREDSFCFSQLELKQKDIKLLNKILTKRNQSIDGLRPNKNIVQITNV